MNLSVCIWLFLTLGLSLGKHNHQKSHEARVKEPQTTSEKIKKNICMTLSRMHIQQHMQSIEEALDSQDEEGTVKLATLLDSSYRKCMKNVDNSHFLKLQNLLKFYQKQEPKDDLEDVFGEVEYEVQGKLVEPFSREQSHKEEFRKSVRSKVPPHREQDQQHSQSRLDLRKAGLANRRQRNSAGLDQISRQESDYNYEPLQHINSLEEIHSDESNSTDEVRSHDHDHEAKSLAVQEPPEDIHVVLQKTLQHQSRSIFFYLYPLVIAAAVGYASATKIKEKWLIRSKLAQIPVDLAKVLRSEDDFPLSSIALCSLKSVSDAVQTLRTKDKKVLKVVLANYLVYLIEKMKEQPSVTIRNLIKETDRELSLLPFEVREQMFSSDLKQMMKDPTSLIKLVQLAWSKEEQTKRFVMMGIYPYVSAQVPVYIEWYMEDAGVDPKLDVFHKLILDSNNIRDLNYRLEYLNMKPYKQRNFINTVIDIVAIKFGNTRLSERIIEQMVNEQSPLEERKILFALKMSSYFVYKHHDISKTFKVVSQMTNSQIFCEYLRRSVNKNFQELAPIFKLLKTSKEGSKDDVYRQYAFSQECPFKDTLELFKFKFIRVYNKSAVELLDRIREQNVDVGEHYKEIQTIFRPYRNKQQVKDMLEVLHYCHIFYCFGVNQTFRLVERVLRNMDEFKVFQQQALRLHKQMILGYCSRKWRRTHLVLADESLDLQHPVSLLKVTRHLINPFYQSQVSLQRSLYSQIYEAFMINKTRYQGSYAINELLKKKVYLEFKLEGLYPKLTLFLQNQIEKTLQTYDEFAQSQDYLQQMINIINLSAPKNEERLEDPAKLKLFKYLWAKGVRSLNPDAGNTIGIKLLELTFTHPNIVEQQLYKLILDANNKAFSQDCLETNEYKLWLGVKAKWLFGVQNIEEGIQTLEKIVRSKPPSWFCNLLIQIMNKHPCTQQKLVQMAFQYAFGDSQFMAIQEIYQGIHVEDSFSKELPLSSLGRSSTFTNQKKYSLVVKEITDSDSNYCSAEFRMFFRLVGTVPRHAFYYALKKGLPLVMIDLFLERCRDIRDKTYDQLDQWMFKLVYFLLLGKLTQRQITFQQFASTLTQHDFSGESPFSSNFSQLLQDPESTPSGLSLLNKYYKKGAARAYKLFLPPGFFASMETQNKWLQNADSDSVCEVSRILKNAGVNFLQQSISSICGHLNSGSQSPYGGLYKQNIVVLMSLDRQECRKAIQLMVYSLKKVTSLVQLVKTLMTYNHSGFSLTQIVESYNLEIIRILGDVEQDSQSDNNLIKLLPSSFLYTPIEKEPVQTSKLSEDHIHRLKECIESYNVFVLAKVMFFVYHMSVQIEEEVYRLFEEKFSGNSDIVTKFLEVRRQKISQVRI